MDVRPFTFAEAEEICEDFEDLKDTEFTFGSLLVIVEDVLIAPYNAADKDLFLAAYIDTRDSALSLTVYAGAEFDVVLVVSDVSDETAITYITINQYIAEKGVHYNFPE